MCFKADGFFVGASTDDEVLVSLVEVKQILECTQAMDQISNYKHLLEGSCTDRELIMPKTNKSIQCDFAAHLHKTMKVTHWEVVLFCPSDADTDDNLAKKERRVKQYVSRHVRDRWKSSGIQIRFWPEDFAMFRATLKDDVFFQSQWMPMCWRPQTAALQNVAS
jgi:hypothetical protein